MDEPIEPSPPPAVVVPTHRARLQLFLSKPDTFDDICEHVANGGSLLDLSRQYELRYSSIMQWIRADKARSARYDQAYSDRSEWMRQRVLQEVSRLGLSDIRGLFNPDGSLKKMTEMTADQAAAIQAVEVDEIYEFDAEARRKVEVGVTRKVKLWDKIKALEALGREVGLFTPRTQVDMRVTLEDIVSGSFDPGAIQPGRAALSGPGTLTASGPVIQVIPVQTVPTLPIEAPIQSPTTGGISTDGGGQGQAPLEPPAAI